VNVYPSLVEIRSVTSDIRPQKKAENPSASWCRTGLLLLKYAWLVQFTTFHNGQTHGRHKTRYIMHYLKAEQ